MKIELTEWSKDWRGHGPQQPAVAVLDLEDERDLFALLVSLGNGCFDEARFEFETAETGERVRGLLVGTGGATRVEPSAVVEKTTLYRSSDDVYVQGDSSFFFVSPVPAPERFSRPN